MNLGLELTGDREVTLRFETFPQAVHARLLAAMQQIEQRLQAAVIAAQPSRSGALRSMTGGRVYDHGNRIAAVVGVRANTPNEAKKAAALEYGSRGMAVTVRTHTASLDHLWARAIAPIRVTVPDHHRVPNIRAQRFLRGPLDAMAPSILQDLAQAVDDAATGAPT